MSATSNQSSCASSSRRPSTKHDQHHRRQSSTSTSDKPRTPSKTRSSLSNKEAYALYYRSIAIFPPSQQSQPTSRLASPNTEQPPPALPQLERRYTSPRLANEFDLQSTHSTTDPSYFTRMHIRSSSFSELSVQPRAKEFVTAGSTSEEDDAAATFPPISIDWTSPSTRRREYDRIDRNSRGLRKLWRKLCPWTESEVQFHGEGDSETGSVRRYRVDLPDGEED